MSDRPTPLEIPAEILKEVYRHARASFPDECCGWLAGPRDSAGVSKVRPCVNDQSSGGHPSKPERTAERAYVFAPADLQELNLSLDGEEPPRIIYHSHPNGHAYFSETDRSNAADPWGEGKAYPVQQLVVGIDAQWVVEAALFDWWEGEDGFVEIARFEGADI